MKKLLEEAYAALCNSGTNVRTLQGLRESEIRDKLRAAIDAPEPYDQQALELCELCGWKAIVPGEPCLMCERNAKMCEPEQKPVCYASFAENGNIRMWSKSKDHAKLQPLYTKPQPVADSGCTRSHPHENMSPMCELRTEIARIKFEASQPVADLTDDEIKMLAKSVYGSCNHTQDVKFARAVLAAQKSKR